MSQRHPPPCHATTHLVTPASPHAGGGGQVAALAADKHERALVPNVVPPAEIGVSYAQIGGLAEVKAALQQCITYPLKYPHLYSEGIAAEAVKVSSREGGWGGGGSLRIATS